LDAGPIINKNGAIKNSCERNNTKRLLKYFKKTYPESLENYNFLMASNPLEISIDYKEHLEKFINSIFPILAQILFTA
jgi:ribonuclease P protein component